MTVAGQTSTLKRVGAGLAGQPTSQMNSPAARCKAGEDFGDFADRSEPVAHEPKMAILKGGSSASASNQPDTRLNAIPTIESAMVAVASQPSQ